MRMREKPEPEYREGSEAAQRFERAINRVLSVPKDELTKREAAYKEKRRTVKSSRRTK